jgi:general stress protein 26
MAMMEPTAELDARFSSPSAAPTPWTAAQEALGTAEIFWVTTVRPDGRPHVTPLIAVWLDGTLYFCTGATERKALNLAQNAHCVVTTGCNTYAAGLDLVLEGDAVQVHDDTILQRIAEAYQAKYGTDWHFDVRDGAFVGGEGNVAQVYAVAPAVVFGFSKGEPFSQTRWKF